MQLEAPAPLNVPAAHTVCLDDASEQYEPAGQGVHVFALVALVAAEYLPASQFVGTVIPEAAQYVPGGHRMQADSALADSVAE